MKRLLLLLFLVLLASNAFGETAITLFLDEERDSNCCNELTIYEAFAYVRCYLIIKLPEDGAYKIFFKIVLNSSELGLLEAGTLNNIMPPEVFEQGGCAWFTGVTINFGPCLHSDWCVVTDFVFGTYVGTLPLSDCILAGFGPHDDNGCLGFMNCGSLANENADIVQGLYVNCDPCPANVGVRSSTWGAIKRLYE